GRAVRAAGARCTRRCGSVRGRAGLSQRGPSVQPHPRHQRAARRMSLTRTDVSISFRETLAVLGDEGFRLFFPLAALHAALWPFLWVVAFGFSLPLATTLPAGLWHAHEMLIGSFGAALIGFITT